MSETTLLNETRELINSRSIKITHAEIAEVAGISVPSLIAIANGRTRNPSVNTIQKIYEFLSGEKLLNK